MELNEEQKTEEIKQIKKDIETYKNFKHYKEECIINANISLKLLKR